MLVEILNQDEALNAWLGTQPKPPLTLAEFKRIGEAWQQKRHAVTYCIWTDRPVGTISLSHRTADGQALIGYWLASHAWGKRIATQAFARVLALARDQGIRQVSATIDNRNTASLRLWRRHGAVEEGLEDGRIRVRLVIVY